jgi:hypothetical protein
LVVAHRARPEPDLTSSQGARRGLGKVVQRLRLLEVRRGEM